ncbi:MAG: YiiD C-terminal domain-containing protein [Arenimonas sp.]
MQALAELDRLFAGMPPVAAMAIRSEDFDGDVLRLRAPLAANVNDKHCAFGGSLASLMTLAGWGWLMLRTAESGFAVEVYVADSQVRYLTPLYADLLGSARLAPGEDWPATMRCLAERGRARAAMLAEITAPDGSLVATLAARFALKRA